MPAKQNKLLKENDTCWRIRHADRAAVLVDGADYYGAVRAACLKARRSIFIVGWDTDSRTRLVGWNGVPDDGAPATLRDFLLYLVKKRPELNIYILTWDFSALYSLEREGLMPVKLDWSTPRQITVCLDDTVPLGASHHQKLVVIDDAIAFSGGLDLTVRRWDNSDHDPANERRVDPNGTPYGPYHDVQMCVDGEACRLIAEHVRERWQTATGRKAVSVKPTGDPWPGDLKADFEDIAIGMARTHPKYGDFKEVREVERLFLETIGTAQKTLYVENQFLTSEKIADALVERIRENSALQVLLITPESHDSWLEARSMRIGRLAFLRRLKEGGILDRVRVAYPVVENESKTDSVMIHSKVMVADDRFIRVGSANLNNRSLGTDTEFDLAIEASTERERKSVVAVRNRLLGEHVGLSADAVRDYLKKTKSILKLVDDPPESSRRLQPIEPTERDLEPADITFEKLADPEQPIELARYMGDMFGAKPAARTISRLGRLALMIIGLVVIAAIWRFTPLYELTDTAAILPFFDMIAQSDWTVLIIPLVFIIGGLVVFPVTVLIALMGALFGPVIGLAYALSGTILSAMVTYGIGAAAGKFFFHSLMGPRLNQVSRALGRRGVLSIAATRVFPVAPFSIINVAAGASHIGFFDYMAGTILGMFPGIVVMTLLGGELAKMLENPTVGQTATVGLFLVLWLIVIVGFQALIIKLRNRGND